MGKYYHCAHCGKRNWAFQAGSINRAMKLGRPVYCDRSCFGLAHRKHKSIEQRKAEKSAYDAARRTELGAILLEKKRLARIKLLTENPELVRAREKANRDANKDRHAEYCRTPEYREWKREYDRQHRANKMFGPFADAFLVLQDLEVEIASRATRYEIYMERGTINKTQRRKREYEQAVGC